MTQSFVTRYLKQAANTNSVLCVGLDLTPKHIPPPLRGVYRDEVTNIDEYARNIIRIAESRVPVVKFQFAHYAALDKVDQQGTRILRNLVRYAKQRGLLTILDVKRSDIGDTMEHYGSEAFDVYEADACTLAGVYFGPTFWPIYKPWLEQGRLIIQMIRTSNQNKPEDDLQMQRLEDGRCVYEYVAKRVSAWNYRIHTETQGLGALGGVVGATHLHEALRCRQIAGPDVFFLIPGYGAQGGGADAAVAGLLNFRNEVMGTVNSSRDITLYSWFDKETNEAREGNWQDFVKTAIERANNDLNTAIERRHTPIAS